MEKTLTKNQSVRIVQRNGRWAVIRAGAKRAFSVHQTKQEAISAGRQLAHPHGEVVVRAPNGQRVDAVRMVPAKSRASGAARESKIRRQAKYRVILFPTTPSITGNQVIGKAVSEVIRELAET